MLNDFISTRSFKIRIVTRNKYKIYLVYRNYIYYIFFQREKRNSEFFYLMVEFPRIVHTGIELSIVYFEQVLILFLSFCCRTCEDFLHQGLIEYLDVNELNDSHIALYEEECVKYVHAPVHLIF